MGSLTQLLLALRALPFSDLPQRATLLLFSYGETFLMWEAGGRLVDPIIRAIDESIRAWTRARFVSFKLRRFARRAY